MKKKKIVITIFEIIFLLMMLYSSNKIINWIQDNQKTEKIIDKISKNIEIDEGNNTKIININGLKEENEDTVAYLEVKGTEISYPVVQTKNNEFYLNHSFDKTESGAGWIFADYKNKFDGTDKNIVIYGHNRRNGSMFSSLNNILGEEWYNNEENKIVKLTTEEGIYNYEVFSVYKTEIEEYYIQTSFESNKFIEFIKTIKERSIKDFNTEVGEDDSILTLSTCANNNQYRIVLHAKNLGLEQE